MEKLRILGVLISGREKHVKSIQDIFTRYGCSIKTRIGLNEMDTLDAPGQGLIILELMGDPQEFVRLENDLLALDGVEVRKMIF